MGRAIVGFQGRASCRLFVSEFFEHSKDRAGMAAALVDASCFSFRGRGDDIFDGLADDVDGAIDSVRSVPPKVVVGCSAASGFGQY